MTQMNFDLEDGKPPVSFALKTDDVGRFVDFMDECHAATTTLHAKGYTYTGGQQWRPPLGPAPDFNLLDAKNATIETLQAALSEVLSFQSAPKTPTIHDYGRWRRALTAGAVKDVPDSTPWPFEIEPGVVGIYVVGATGCGKSGVAGEVEISMKALGVPVEWVNGQAEKNLTHADWQWALDLYKPRVAIFEINVVDGLARGVRKLLKRRP